MITLYDGTEVPDGTPVRSTSVGLKALTKKEIDNEKIKESNYLIELPKKLALSEIKRLEAEITNRRLREATLGIDGGWLANQEALIASQRELL